MENGNTLAITMKLLFNRGKFLPESGKHLTECGKFLLKNGKYLTECGNRRKYGIFSTFVLFDSHLHSQ